MGKNIEVLIIFSLAIVLIAQTTTIVNTTKSYGSVQPIWLTSSFFRAGNQAVITTLTGNTQTPTFTFTFSSSLTALPGLAYGIKNYRGNDYLGQQFYEIKKIGLTQSTFSVSIQIYGVTNLWLLTVAYLAVEPSFPHHFNTFENVPLNYSSGDIANISSKNSQSLTYFTEYINYTAQALGKTHNTFPQPCSSNVIVLFMTSLWIQGTFGKPVKFHIEPSVINSQFYVLNATLQIDVMITNVHFSEVIFNKDDIISSDKYQVVYQVWDNTMNGGWIELPQQFVDNFIMGVTSFQTSDAYCGFQYQWEFANNSGLFGVQLQKSWTLSNTCGFSWSRTSILYIQTWLCNAPYTYYNISTKLCQDQCGGYYIQNTTSFKCDNCSNFMCYQCDPNNQTVCTDCASYDQMQLVNDTCVCISGYFYLQGKCTTCATQNKGCLQCSYGIISKTLTFDASQFQCYTCNQTSFYFLANGSCVGCPTERGYSLDNVTQICSAIACGDSLTAIGLQACDDGNIIDGDGCSSICQKESNFNCTILTNFTTVCLPICGDNTTYITQACDDGNIINGDGCSFNCKIQVSVKLINHQRDMAYCNRLQFQFQLSPYYSFLDTANFSSLITMNSSALISPFYSYYKPILSLSYDFTEDMTLKRLEIAQNDTTMLAYPNYIFYFGSPIMIVKPNNNVAVNFLDEQQCKQKQFYGKAFKYMQTASFVVLLLSMVPGKIIGLQLFGVLQLAYFSVGSIDSVNVLLTPLMSMKQLNGYSNPILGSSSDELPQRVKSIQYYPSFLDNFNVMFLLMLVQFMFGVVLYIAAKLLSNAKLHNLANKLLKEFFLTLLLFNCFNISYASGIYFRYNTDSPFNLSFIVAIISLTALFVMTIMFIFVNPDGFGEFKQKFKTDIMQLSYMSISILYRSLVGFLLAFSNDDDLSTLFTLGLSLLFVIYNLINLPFVKAYHNYRACLCHFSQFITIFVAMYYRSMKSTTSPSQVAVIFSPAKIEFSVLFITLLASIMVVIYDSYLYVKELTCFKKKQTDVNNTSHEQLGGNIMISEINNDEIIKKSDVAISQINQTQYQIEEISGI